MYVIKKYWIGVLQFIHFDLSILFYALIIITQKRNYKGFISMNQQNSIQNQLREIIDEQLQVNYQQKINQLHDNISQLNQQEQILKQTLKIRQREVHQIFASLHQKKRKLTQLIINKANQETINLDIGLFDQFNNLRDVLQAQRKQIDQLRSDINKQGLTGGNSDQQFIKLKHKRQEIQRQIEVGKRFSSTQYVRDYLQKPQAFKIAYEDVKYQYQIRVKIKDSLQNQKTLFKKKQEEINKAIKRQKQIQQQLLQEKDYLLAISSK